jgi:hypothetical protein
MADRATPRAMLIPILMRAEIVVKRRPSSLNQTALRAETTKADPARFLA